MSEANDLKTLRKKLGLTQAQVASFSRTKTWEVKLAEDNSSLNKSKEKIRNYLKKECARVKKEEIKLKEAAEKKKAFFKEFKTGKKYYICTLKKNAYKRNKSPFNLDTTDCLSGNTWDKDCTFEYIKDEGIHHCFKAVQGGWSRTYTNAQLVDKHVMEVE